MVELPLVMPPAVAGIGLLAALGPRRPPRRRRARAHVQLVLETAGVVVALVFVAAPFYLRQAQTGSRRSIPRCSMPHGRSASSEAATFLRVAIPVASPGLAAGLALAWGRALGEFGATLMFAGSFQGITQTVPLAIYDQFAVNFPAVLALSAILVLVSASLLLTVKLVAGSATLGSAGG